MNLLAPSRTRPRRAVATGTVLVPVLGSDAETQHAVAVAATLAGAGSTLRLVAVVEVPATLPLDAQLPEAEREARDALARALAVADAEGVHATTELRRARDVGAALVEAADAGPAAAVVVAASVSARRRGPNVDRVTRTLLRRARSRVVVLRQPRS
jgi:nucleotide-binding universal stress UspA family protein